MSDLGAQRTYARLITGDFNDLLDNDEKEGGPLRWEGSFLSFRNFVSQNGLWNLQFSGNSLSRGEVRDILTSFSHVLVEQWPISTGSSSSQQLEVNI